MAFNFPINPAVDQEYIGPNGVVYTYDGDKWNGTAQLVTVSGGGGTVSGDYVGFTSATGAALLPSGTTAERPVGEAGMMRYNTDVLAMEFWNTNISDWDTLPSTSPFINPTTTTGQTSYTSPGTYSWVCPADVYYVSVVAIGGGGAGYGGTSGGCGGGGGGLGWDNNIPVIPGRSYPVVVGTTSGDSTFTGTTAVYNFNAWGGGTYTYTNYLAVAGYGGKAGGNVGGLGGAGGSYYPSSQGGNGGMGGSAVVNYTGGGGGAGGYSGNGGAGATNYAYGSAGTGGGGGGGGGSSETYVGGGFGAGGGGGTGIFGEGSSGNGGTAAATGQRGQGGSGGVGLGATRGGGEYGGGAGGYDTQKTTSGAGASGAVRIIWGANRAFPSTNTGDM